MTHHTYYLLLNRQLQSVIVPSKLKNKSLKNFCCRCQLGIKIPGTDSNKMFLIFQTFCSIILLRMKYSKKEHLQIKILQNLEILPCQNTLVVYFFVSQILH